MCQVLWGPLGVGSQVQADREAGARALGAVMAAAPNASFPHVLEGLAHLLDRCGVRIRVVSVLVRLLFPQVLSILPPFIAALHLNAIGHSIRLIPGHQTDCSRDFCVSVCLTVS